MNPITLLIGAGIFVTAGDLFLAGWARVNYIGYLVAGLLLNLTGIVFYAFSLRAEIIGIATAIFLGLNIFAVSLGAYFLFDESIPLRGAIGISLIIISIMLMEV